MSAVEPSAAGTPDELRPVLDGLSAAVTLHIVEQGDHSLAPPKRKSEPAVDQVYDDVQDRIVDWVRDVSSAPTP